MQSPNPKINQKDSFPFTKKKTASLLLIISLLCSAFFAAGISYAQSGIGNQKYPTGYSNGGPSGAYDYLVFTFTNNTGTYYAAKDSFGKIIDAWTSTDVAEIEIELFKLAPVSIKYTSGNFTGYTPVYVPSNVKLQGAGMYQTIRTGTLALGNYSIFTLWGNATNPIVNVEISNMYLSGENMLHTPDGLYGGKAIHGEYIKNSTFQNLYVYDAPVTGFGIDHLDGVLIDHVISDGCGQRTGLGIGSNGIGIGVGGWGKEINIITNCIAKNNKNNGFTFEYINGQGIGYANNYILSNNYAYNNSNAGCAISGASYCIITGNHFYENYNGIIIKDYFGHPLGNTITGNNVYNNTNIGIGSEYGVGTIVEQNQVHYNGIGFSWFNDKDGSIKNNFVSNNDLEGIYATNCIRTVIDDNRVWDNGQNATAGRKGGIHVATITKGQANNNYLFDSGVGKQAYGMEINLNCDDIMAIGNYIFNSTAYDFYIPSATTDRAFLMGNNFVSISDAGTGTIIKNNVVNGAFYASGVTP